MGDPIHAPSRFSGDLVRAVRSFFCCESGRPNTQRRARLRAFSRRWQGRCGPRRTVAVGRIELHLVSQGRCGRCGAHSKQASTRVGRGRGSRASTILAAVSGRSPSREARHDDAEFVCRAAGSRTKANGRGVGPLSGVDRQAGSRVGQSQGGRPRTGAVSSGRLHGLSRVGGNRRAAAGHLRPAGRFRTQIYAGRLSRLSRQSAQSSPRRPHARLATGRHAGSRRGALLGRRRSGSGEHELQGVSGQLGETAGFRDHEARRDRHGRRLRHFGAAPGAAVWRAI